MKTIRFSPIAPDDGADPLSPRLSTPSDPARGSSDYNKLFALRWIAPPLTHMPGSRLLLRRSTKLECFNG